MPHPARLLGFAFANADFLFEVDANGTIRFALGAAGDLVRQVRSRPGRRSRPVACLQPAEAGNDSPISPPSA